MRLLLVVVAAVSTSLAVAAPTSAAPAKGPLGGDTALLFAPASVNAFEASGVFVTAIGKAGVGDEGLAFSFPISSAAILAKGRTLRRATVIHGGGLRLSNGAAVLELFKPAISITSAGTRLTVRSGRGRIGIAQLRMSRATYVRGSASTSIKRISSTLTAVGASLLNSTFGTTAFDEGMAFASAAVVVRHRA